MKIVDVVAEKFSYRSQIVPDSNGHVHPGPEHESSQTLIRIITDEGVEGYSFGGNPTVIENIVRPALIGEDPFYRERLWRKLREKQRIFRSFMINDLYVIDLALWDLAGRALNLPVYKLIGGNRNKVKAYASTMCGDNLEGGLNTPEAYAKFALACKARGYQGFKMHLWMSPLEGAPNWKRDIEACRAVRASVGNDMVLMLDCSGSYNRQEALLLGRELEKLDFYWIEEPIFEANISSYVWLAKQLNIAVLGPETPQEIETRAEWIVREASDINRCGAQDVGGITPLLKVVHLFETFGVPFDMHMSGPGNLQVLGATGIGEYYERGLLHPFIDYEVPPPYLNTIFDPMDQEGFVLLSDNPGVGWDINFEYIKAHKLA